MLYLKDTHITTRVIRLWYKQFGIKKCLFVIYFVFINYYIIFLYQWFLKLVESITADAVI